MIRGMPFLSIRKVCLFLGELMRTIELPVISKFPVGASRHQKMIAETPLLQRILRYKQEKLQALILISNPSKIQSTR
jgi:hypothetical protein